MGLLCLALDEAQRDVILNYVPKQANLETLANFFAAFGDETRLKIVSALLINEMCVSDISLILKINQTTVSHQLKYLRNLNIVESTRNGKIIFYKITDKNIKDVLLHGTNFIF
jgi:ArsR family transcriptional regulator